MSDAAAFDSIGPYRVIRKIATGGQGSVFECDLQSGQRVGPRRFAVKLLNEQSSHDRFQQELLLARLVAHSGVVQVLDHGVHEGQPYIVLELMQKSLGELVAERGELTVDEIGAFAFQVLEGIRAIHEYGIVHRDLKPSNILIGFDGVVRVSDFGVATVGQRDESTRFGEPVGSPSYMSPEQVVGGAVDYRSDIYSFGRILDLLVGRTLADPQQAMSLNAEGLASIIEKCSEKVPGERYQDVDELQLALEKAFGEELRPSTSRSDLATITSSSGPALLPDGTGRMVSPTEAAVIAFDHARQKLLGTSAGYEPGRLVIRILGRTSSASSSHAVELEFLPNPGFDGEAGRFAVVVSETGEVLNDRLVRAPRPVSRMAGIASHRRAIASAALMAVIALVVTALILLSLDSGTDAQSGSPETSVSVTVSAESPWIPTGLAVNSGDRLVVSASGQAGFTGCCASLPDGSSETRGVQGNPERGSQPDQWVASKLPYAALVGRIGEDGLPFYIGSFSELVAPVTGEVFLSMNDTLDAFHDNSGIWDAEISVDQQPLTRSETGPPLLQLSPTARLDMLEVSWSDELNFETGFVVIDAESGQPMASAGPDVTSVEISLPARGDTKCLYVRPSSDRGYRLPSVTSCFTNLLESETLAVQEIIKVPGGPSRLAVSPDEKRLAVSTSTTVSMFDADSMTEIGSVRVPVESPRTLVDMAFDRTAGNLMVLSGGSDGGNLHVISAETMSIESTVPLKDIEALSLLFDPDDHDRVVIAGGSGWAEVDLSTKTIQHSVVLDEQKSTRAFLSPDGQVLYGQRGNSTSQDGVFAFDRESGELIAEFIYGDLGGTALYFPTPGDDRLLSFVGDGALNQNVYVLESDDLAPVQELGVPGIGDGAISSDGASVLTIQNRDTWHFAQGGGLRIHRITPVSTDRWVFEDVLELSTGTRSGNGSIESSPRRGRYYVVSPQSDELYVIDEK